MIASKHLQRGLLLALLAVSAPSILPQQASAASATVRVFSAGSMRGALTAIAHDYEAATGDKIDLTFGPAGLLRERIETGGGADVYVSANMAHPQRLADHGKALPPVVFAKNSLCITGRATLGLTSETALDKLLDPAVKIGTSTPGADPGGDYAWQLFAQAEKVHPGATALLESKAKQLVGGPNSPKVPAGENALHYFMAQNEADVFIGYCSSHRKLTEPAEPTDIPVTRVAVPASLSFPIGYGMTVIADAANANQTAVFRFALYLMSPAAQKLLPDYGFKPGGSLWPQ